MPETFYLNKFDAGWVPSDDAVNGRKNGLLAMDNLELDRNGALSLIGGTELIGSQYQFQAHDIFSNVISGAEHLYVADMAGFVFRDSAAILAGGDSFNTAFGTAYNFTLIASGSQRLKDPGTGVPLNLGILPPSIAPTVSHTPAGDPISLIGNPIFSTVDIAGSSIVFNGYLQITTDPVINDGIVRTRGNLGVSNCNVMLDHNLNKSYATDNDYVVVSGYTVDPTFLSLEFTVLLQPTDNNGAIPQPEESYKYTVLDVSKEASFDSLSGAFTIRIKRSDFRRQGNGLQDWSTVYGFDIMVHTAVGGTVVNIWASAFGASFYMIGGDKTQNGTYQYVQINVNNTGSYIAKSSIGPISDPVTLPMCQAYIQPQDPRNIDPQCNEAWIYRRGIGGATSLEKWYRVKVFNGVTGFVGGYDTMSDADAQTLNLTIDSNLVSIASSSITDKIYAIVGPIEGRWFYFTTNFMYPSDINDPDLVNASLAVRICGSNSEIFLWAKMIGESTVLVGTSKEIYILTGTFTTLADGSVDIYYRPLGCKYPPITYDADVYAGSVFYLAADGWRSENGQGSNVLLVAPNTDRLYRGINCYGYQVYTQIIPGTVRFPCVVAQGKLWCGISGQARIEVLDFVRQYWRPVVYGFDDVRALHRTQTGKIIAFFTKDARLRYINSNSTLLDGTNKQTINIITPVFDNNQPRNRKEMYTFKARINTGGDFVTVNLARDDGTMVTLGTFNANSLQTISADISSFVQYPIKYFQFYITGSVGIFSLSDISLDYDLRPAPVTFLRLLPNNYGSPTRKRMPFTNFVVDALGNTVTITSKIDGVLTQQFNVSGSGKLTVPCQFNTDDIGVDYEYTLWGNGGLFEYYGGGDASKFTEVFPEKLQYLHLPITNFGNACKKRLRVWPFLIDTFGQDLTFIPIVDGVSLPAVTINTAGKQTVRVEYTTDVFGVDYSGYFYGALFGFELWQVMEPEIVQVLPIAKRFDQVGPEELFRIGKVQKLELRILPFGTAIPFTVYFSDASSYVGSFVTIPGVEATYITGLPKGTTGSITRIEFGPTTFDFHRYYVRLLVALEGKDAETRWVTIPDQAMDTGAV